MASYNGTGGGSGQTVIQNLSGSTLSRATPGALGALATSGVYSDGTTALVLAMRSGGGPGLYVLQPAVSSTPDSFFVVATSDDATKQWVYAGIAEQGVASFLSGDLDFTATQTITMFPPLGYRLGVVLAPAWFVTTRDGTVTAGPTAQAGTDAGITNYCASTVQSTMAGAAVNTRSTMNGAVAASTLLDATTNGARLQITVGATLGTATTFRGRVGMTAFLAKY